MKDPQARQAPSEPGIIKQIRSPLMKASPPLLHRRESGRFQVIHRLKFSVDISSFRLFKREEIDHRPLFYLIP
jgi:hypothetical protein